MVGDVPGVARSLAGRRDQHGSLDGIADFDGCSTDGSRFLAAQRPVGIDSAPPRLESGARPSLVNGTLCAPHGVCSLICPFMVYGISPVASAARSALPTPAHSNRSGSVEHGISALLHAELVGEPDVAHVRAVDVESQLDSGPPEVERVGIVQLHHQVKDAAPNPDLLQDDPVEPDPGLLEGVAQSGAAPRARASPRAR